MFAIHLDVEFVTQLSVGKTITSWLKDAQGLAIMIVTICARRQNGRKQLGFIRQFQLVPLLDLFWRLLLWHVLSLIFTGKRYYLAISLYYKYTVLYTSYLDYVICFTFIEFLAQERSFKQALQVKVEGILSLQCDSEHPEKSHHNTKTQKLG